MKKFDFEVNFIRSGEIRGFKEGSGRIRFGFLRLISYRDVIYEN